MTLAGFAQTLLYLTILTFLVIFTDKIRTALKNKPHQQDSPNGE